MPCEEMPKLPAPTLSFNGLNVLHFVHMRIMCLCRVDDSMSIGTCKRGHCSSHTRVSLYQVQMLAHSFYPGPCHLALVHFTNQDYHCFLDLARCVRIKYSYFDQGFDKTLVIQDIYEPSPSIKIPTCLTYRDNPALRDILNPSSPERQSNIFLTS